MINLSIRARLLLLVAFPVVLLLIYIGIDLRENYRLMHEMEETAVLTGFSSVSNDLVHSLQAERGRSVGWLNGHADRKPIEDTRADTDRAQAALNDFIRTAELPAAIRSDLGSLQNDLATLAALRQSVDDKSISPADSLARYTKAIDGLFRFVTVLQQNSSDPVLARDVSAMLGLLCQKEFAGRERAMINGALAAGSFAPGSRDRAMLGLGQQQACQSQFERFAESFMVEAYTMIRTTPEYSGSIGLRERILAPDADLAALGIPAAEWFRQSSLHIDAIKGMLDTVALTLQAKVAQRVEETRTHLLIGTGIALGLLVVLAVLLTMTLRSILSPIRRLQQLMDRMSDTFDLSARANIRGTHEVARMARSFDRLVDAFEQAVGDVENNARFLSGAAGQLAQISQQASQASSAQTESSCQIAAATEEMSTGIACVVDNAKASESNAQAAREMAERGVSSMAHTAEEIRRTADQVKDTAVLIDTLHERSQAISQIIVAIRDIADQTNLLALNAAIEAARAGEQGRGFAVVADEVRKLAERTSSATLEITSLIGAIRSDTDRVAAGMGDASRQMHQGLELLGESSAALARIRETAEETLAKNSEISMAMQEQSHTSNDVAGNIQRIAEQNEQTSRLVAESAEIAGSLSQTASQLEALVGRFRITRG
ncbi:methyl-accepting chemotaxis protein [Laribacter hongkongensis]|uniref:Probable methyl-accepting chemotaxis protein n=1 Tax=Laribacter hongkongensis (strain HLHK9) TaxID=557598 RepID=C1DCW1_LARHH|nr:methyl-accepting chemotaxis protein [Laribacter hongkongensis]ACO73596.1 probable methyl-accepting chemotaxis protein [Laribacter hongkongensis HLHK9]MCG8994960.1 methyl-accepting chemotaxis protein [Laribacter hongkongensis]MCG9010438.1 methyl-accepting chemotaxis protein [Laribacter hongkongensis]MCG9022177.1 methyl-accepting chemotaxis protein [Laribacter hongkongensis]MCG9046439.1 methyl-accepting chemotaxis protein [Laribacter hongkongensis]